MGKGDIRSRRRDAWMNAGEGRQQLEVLEKAPAELNKELPFLVAGSSSFIAGD